MTEALRNKSFRHRRLSNSFGPIRSHSDPASARWTAPS